MGHGSVVGMLLPLLGSALAAGPPHIVWTGPLAQHADWLPLGVPTPEPARPTDWTSFPVATALHPIYFQYGRRHQEVLARTMGGPHASSVFGPTVAEADVHWRLLDATGYGLPIDEARSTEWRDAGLAASLLAAQAVLDETLTRAPILHAVWTVGDAFLSPSFDARSEGDRLSVTHRIGGPQSRALERRAEAAGEAHAPPTSSASPKKPTSTLGAGLDWALRGEDAGPHAPLLRYTAWIAGTEIGLSTFRLEVAPPSLAWTLTAREHLLPRLYAIGSARSLNDAPDPARVSAGLMWVAPGNRWNLRVERIIDLAEADERWMISLRREDRTAIPAPLSPALGDRGLGGQALPYAPPAGPNRVAPW